MTVEPRSVPLYMCCDKPSDAMMMDTMAVDVSFELRENALDLSRTLVQATEKRPFFGLHENVQESLIVRHVLLRILQNENRLMLVPSTIPKRSGGQEGEILFSVHGPLGLGNVRRLVTDGGPEEPIEIAY